MGCTLPYNNNSYQEEILAFYMDEDANNLAILGKEYHYIFHLKDKRNIDVLKAKQLLNYTANDLHLTLYRMNNNNISAHINLDFNKNNLNEEQISWLESHQFYQLEHKNGEVENLYTGNFSFSGKAYLSSIDINKKIKKINNSFFLDVEDSEDKILEPSKTPLIYQDNQLELNSYILYPFF